MVGTGIPDFMWAVGIEDTFIPQEASRTGRVLDEYELTQHYRFWREDLALAASLGVRTIRYGIPWYRVNPAPGVFDWSWTDQVLPYMIQDLGIEPIVDLVHYGCPLWLDRAFINPAYPERVAEYARAFVERYRGLTRFYTPLNEPLITCRHCGYTAYWPPHLRGWPGYVRILTALAHGMSLTVAAIRELQPDAIIVQAEASSSNIADDPSLEDDLQFVRRRQFLPNDLLMGRVDEGHPLVPWLLRNGASPAVLDWLRAHPQPLDIVGINFYPGLSCFRLERQDGAAVRKRYHGGAVELERVLQAYHEHYRKPIMLTEISTTGNVRRRERWLDESLAVVRDMRGNGVPIVGYTWWPMFSLVTWRYRGGRKAADAYLAHMGLWDLCDEAGALQREPTSLVDTFRRCVQTPP
ncbi:MAG TPA: family 1 glycosylhydrolase [Herpetosiphonaceae bacterium]|nr:family 1 glycosylhydrolase [Herpetosiphonaceae bacterium]